MADTASSEPTVEVQETEGKFVAPTAEVVVMEVEPDADNLQAARHYFQLTLKYHKKTPAT